MKVEVKEAQSNEVDWTKNPQLVTSEHGTVIITGIYQDMSNEDSFSGLVLVAGDDSDDKVGDYDTLFSKKVFKPFHGEITLKND